MLRVDLSSFLNLSAFKIIIYYWFELKSQFWLFTLYDKDEMSDLGQRERKALLELLNQELGARK
jgi:hypothetical protein